MRITNYHQLDILLTNKVRKDFFIKIPQFTTAENKDMETKFKRLIRPCGCDYGGYFLTFALVVYTIIQFFFLLSFTQNMAALIGVASFSMIGKVVGIIIGKSKLKQEVTKIKHIALERME